MSEDLKKVGLIFTADGVVDFKKSLSSVNTELSKNRAEFKLVKSEWDNHTKASTKLAETNKYLSEQYESSSKKVAVLTSEIDKLEKAETRDEAAINKKKTQLSATTTVMNNYKKGLEETNEKIKRGTADIEEYSKKLSNMSNKTTSVGKSITKGLTLPLAAVGTASVVAWQKIDDAYDNIILKTGATGEKLNELTDSFDTVFGSMPVDANVVSEAIGEVNTRFKLTGTELEKVSSYMIEFATITGRDVTSSVAIAQKIQGQWNLTLDDTQNAMGLVAKVSQDTGINVDTLMESVTKNSDTFKEMGLSVGQSINILGNFESAGIDTETMIVGLKKAAANYSKQNKSMEDGLSELIIKLKDSSTESEATAEAYEMFGIKAGHSFITAAKEGKINLDNVSSDLSSYRKVVEDTYNATLDPMDKAKIAQNNFLLSGKELGEAIQEYLGPILQSLSLIILDLTSWFKGLDDNSKGFIITIGAILIAIGPLTTVFGVMFSGLSNIINIAIAIVTFVTSTVLPLISTIVATIGFIPLAIAAVIGIIVLLYTKCEWFRDGINAIIDFVLTKFNDFISFLGNIFVTDWTEKFGFLGEYMNAFFYGISSIFEDIKGIFNDIIGFIQNVFSGNWSAAWDSVVSIFGGIFNMLIDMAKFPINCVIGMINGMISAVESGVNWCISAINNISFSLPDWLGGKTFGFDIGMVGLGRIPMLAKGGELMNGSAIVAEAGPELLMQNGNSTKVVPLSGQSKNKTEIIDYEKMAKAFIKAMKYMSITLNKEKVGEFVDNRILEAM